jgi:hypothetical protein
VAYQLIFRVILALPIKLVTFLMLFYKKHLTDSISRVTFASAYEKSMFRKINGTKKKRIFLKFFRQKVRFYQNRNRIFAVPYGGNKTKKVGPKGLKNSLGD